MKLIAFRTVSSLLVAGWCLWCGCSRSNSGQVALANSGFESGVIAPWLPFQAVQGRISAEHAHSGNYSLVEDSGGGSFYGDAKGLREGASYTISAWVFADPGATTTAQIGVYDPGTNIATFSAFVTPKGNWQLVRHTMKAGSAATLRVHLFRSEGTGKIYWDDVKVSQN